MQKTFNFGLITVYPHRRARVTVDVNWKDGNFSAMGQIGNFYGGQCLDTIAEFVTDPVFLTIYHLWQKWHLNDVRAGTPRQMKAVEGVDGPDWYGNAGALLKRRHMYTVSAKEADPFRKHEGNKGKPFKFGFEWLKFPVIVEDVALIEALFKEE